MLSCPNRKDRYKTIKMSFKTQIIKSFGCVVNVMSCMANFGSTKPRTIYHKQICSVQCVQCLSHLSMPWWIVNEPTPDLPCLRVHSGERGGSAFPPPPLPPPLSGSTSASSLGGLRGGSSLRGGDRDGGGEDSLGGVDGDDDDEDEIWARFINLFGLEQFGSHFDIKPRYYVVP